MKKVYILASLTLLGQSSLSFAQIRDYQTTRLNSTAGAGVASILSLEAAILNPASAAFFQDGDASYQMTKSSLRHKNDEARAANGSKFPHTNQSQAAFITDYSSQVKGGLSYISQRENDYERTRMGMNAAAPTGDSTSVGLAYRYTMDTRPPTSTHRHTVYHQVVLGMMQILDEDTSLGLVLVDPAQANQGDQRLTGGFQYRIAERFTILADFGYKYTAALSKDYIWNAALQLSLFDDFFIRAGQFYDNINFFKGNGWGASWIGPRLGIEFAQKFSDQFGKNTYIYKGESIVDTSLSAIIKF